MLSFDVDLISFLACVSPAPHFLLLPSPSAPRDCSCLLPPSHFLYFKATYLTSPLSSLPRVIWGLLIFEMLISTALFCKLNLLKHSLGRCSLFLSLFLGIHVGLGQDISQTGKPAEAQAPCTKTVYHLHTASAYFPVYF